ncbi:MULTISPECIES: hypothetical protein [unclassified Butyrivibrio]|uniref:hypothetical protein n=1 Tax=unclassified Butyrivibrio TaxID=2639466 RepID=UPI0003B32A49|nr:MULTISPECIES: hypothetical protein [unclassified Butyrivibrio]
MKKKFLSIVMVSFMALQIVACGEADVASAEVPEAENVAETEVAQETEKPAEADTAEIVETQIPQSADQAQASDFEGQYYAGDGNLSILKQEDGGYLIEVWWGINAAQHGEWVMHGKYDGTDTITYSDCVKHEYTLNENGEVDTDETIYSDGTGSIKIVDASTIMWTDDMEHIADDVPMTR